MIRAADLDDASRIASISVMSWRAAYAGIVPDDALRDLDVDERADRWTRILADGSGTVLVWDDGQVRGFLSGGPCRDDDAGGDLEVYALYVEPDRWRDGIGSALMAAFLSDERTDGVRTARLWVLEANAHGRAFYERCGYVRDGASKSFAIGAAVLPEVRYARALSGA